MNNDKLNQDDCTIGMSSDGMIAIVTIPIKKYALDEINGRALIYGKMREIQAHLNQIAQQIIIKKEELNGLIKPPPVLKVN